MMAGYAFANPPYELRLKRSEVAVAAQARKD
jgi:hypothetical protein